MAGKKMEKLMPQELENWSHYKDGTKANTGERWEKASNQTQEDDRNSILQVSCKARPRLTAGVWAVDLSLQYWTELLWCPPATESGLALGRVKQS